MDIEALVRAEIARREREFQALCTHSRAGLLCRDGLIRCCDCRKVVTEEDMTDDSGERSPIAARQIAGAGGRP